MTRELLFIIILVIAQGFISIKFGDLDFKIAKELNRQADENKRMKDKEFMQKSENFKF